MNEDNDIIRVPITSIILLIFMNDTFFCICIMRDVLLLFSTNLYDWVKYLILEYEKGCQKRVGNSEYKNFNL